MTSNVIIPLMIPKFSKYRHTSYYTPIERECSRTNDVLSILQVSAEVRL
nr:MAG TPA: hypothetical protein [Caudoviricetes sp.]